MRILFLTQWFNPEPNFKGLAFAKELQRQGHRVEILTGFPNYPEGKIYNGYRIKPMQREILDGISVIRVALYPDHSKSAIKRILNYLSFAFSAAILGPLAVSKADVMYVMHPPATIGLPALVISFFRRIPFVYDIQDLWPDTLTATGMVRNSWIINSMGAWCQLIYRRAARIVVLSPGFKRMLIARKIPADHTEIIPNWCDEEPLTKGTLNPDEAKLFEGKFNVVFAGNMGKAQGLETILACAAILKPILPNVQFILVGAGVETASLQKQATDMKLKNVLFLPARPIHDIGAILRRADTLLVHLKRDPLFEITIPSKIQAYLAIGKPILVGVHGDAQTMVEEAGAGIPFTPEDPNSLSEAVQTIATMDQQAFEAMGTRGKNYYRDNLALDIGAAKFIKLFEALKE